MIKNVINRLFAEARFSFEVIILLTAGMVALIAGMLLFPVSRGLLPYYEDGLYGLFLILFSLQIIILGRTPFGDVRRSKSLLATGIVIASVGVVTCFIPGIFGPIPEILLFICFGLGGACLFLQLVISEEKFRSWIKYKGIFHHLIVGCCAVYTLSILIGLLVIQKDMMDTKVTAAIIILYGIAVLYLSWVLMKVYRLYPGYENKVGDGVGLPSDRAMIVLMSVFMVLLGLLLIPVGFGWLPFSGNAQLGLLVFLFAIQMMALGNTPIGPFPRTWLMFLAGLVLASLGTVSCIIPDILVFPLTILVGILNIFGGSATIMGVCSPLMKKSKKFQQPVHPIQVKLFVAQLALGLLSILFGLSMLVSNVLSVLIVGIILTLNGLMLLYLLYLLIVLDRMQLGTQG